MPPRRNAFSIYELRAMRRKKRMRAMRRRVFNPRQGDLSLPTPGGLHMADMKKNRRGCIVSVKVHDAAKMSSWMVAVKMAREEPGIRGFQLIRKDTRLYKVARSIQIVNRAAEFLLDEQEYHRLENEDEIAAIA